MRRLTLVFILGLLLAAANVSAQDVRSDLLGRINGLRASLGLHNYSLNSALTAAAQNHADWMAQTGQISHYQGASGPRDRARAAGYASSWVSENIYMGTRANAERAFNWWVNSPVHYRGMTSDHYYDIGIASASANGQTAFVLVFGNPNATVRVAPPSSGNASSGSSGDADRAAPELPPFVVGWAPDGSILHEVQAGQTLGEIALIYGYDWPDLQMLRDWNDLSEPEGRNLAIGQILQIPPFEGTHTPTAPAAESTQAVAPAEVTEDVALPIIQPTTPTPTLTEPPVTLTAAPSPTEPPATSTDAPSPTDTPPTVTAQPSPTPITPTVDADTGVLWVAVTVTPTSAPAVAMADPPEMNPVVEPAPPVDDDGSSGPPSWLIVAIVGQIIVLTAAGLEFLRRSR